MNSNGESMGLISRIFCLIFNQVSCVETLEYTHLYILRYVLHSH